MDFPFTISTVIADWTAGSPNVVLPQENGCASATNADVWAAPSVSFRYYLEATPTVVAGEITIPGTSVPRCSHFYLLNDTTDRGATGGVNLTSNGNGFDYDTTTTGTSPPAGLAMNATAKSLTSGTLADTTEAEYAVLTDVGPVAGVGGSISINVWLKYIDGGLTKKVGTTASTGYAAGFGMGGTVAPVPGTDAGMLSNFMSLVARDGTSQMYLYTGNHSNNYIRLNDNAALLLASTTWHMYTFVVTLAAGGATGTFSLYIDGLLARNDAAGTGPNYSGLADDALLQNVTLQMGSAAWNDAGTGCTMFLGSTVGATVGAATKVWEGSIARPAVWQGVALSAAEVAHLYIGGTGGTTAVTVSSHAELPLALTPGDRLMVEAIWADRNALTTTNFGNFTWIPNVSYTWAY